ncbi:RsmD family RNA methyltransferase [Tessaracoccus coleopterorum]|uniref:hypothetical protein n=1 Tax=Tessaracoccus coleopterorum TaxID=2714950 RepID=UPI002F90DE4E
MFLDPPYDVATEDVEALLEVLAGTAVAARGLVVVERSSRDRPHGGPPPSPTPGRRRTARRRCTTVRSTDPRHRPVRVRGAGPR